MKAYKSFRDKLGPNYPRAEIPQLVIAGHGAIDDPEGMPLYNEYLWEAYLEYSDSIVRLSAPTTRKQALIELRELERGLRKNTFISTGWNYLSKVIKVWSGVPVPDSSAIANIMKGRTMPTLVSMKSARNQAVEIWKKTDLKNTPLRRDGKPVAEDKDIHWLPPFDSMEIHSPNNVPFKIGTVRELKEALDEALTIIAKKDDE